MTLLRTIRSNARNFQLHNTPNNTTIKHVVSLKVTYHLLSSKFSSDVSTCGYRVLFFGTDDIAVASLRKLHENSLQSRDTPKEPYIRDLHVICPSDRKVGRKRTFESVPVKLFAQEKNIPITEVPHGMNSLRNWDFPVKESFDIGVVVSFGYFLYPHLLANLTNGAINMHPSLLPIYRGPAPIHHALINGDKETGVSIIEIDLKAFDVGRILWQGKMNIPQDSTLPVLAKSLAEMGAEAVLETIKNMKHYKQVAIVQDETNKSHAPKIRPEDGYLNLSESAVKVYNLWRALGDTVGVRLKYLDRELKLITLARPTVEHIESSSAQLIPLLAAPPGTFCYDKTNKGLWLKCYANSSDDYQSLLIITSVQPADKRIMSVVDYANGFKFKAFELHTFNQI